VPENDDEAVEDVEADTQVSTQTVSEDLEQHLNGKQTAEEHVAVLEQLRQRRRLTAKQNTPVSNHRTTSHSRCAQIR